MSTLSEMYALVMNGGVVEQIPQDWRGGEWSEGATVEKRGEIVIIKLDKKKGRGEIDGSMGVIREERGCSGLSSEAERLLHTEAGLCECLFLCACVPVSVFVSKRPNEMMSFQP